MQVAEPPPGKGWVPVKPYAGNEFHNLVLDVWGRLDGEKPVFGFRVLRHHCNPRLVCHGGLLVTFCDFFFPSVTRLTDEETDTFMPTISLTVNFLAPAKLGDWLEGRADTLRRSSNLVFVDGIVSDDKRPVLQASGIFKRGNPDARRAGSAELLERMQQARDGT